MKVEVYKNLHKNCWSVRDNKTGRVINRVDIMLLQDATLVVRPSGRERVLRERRKNVHAFIKGTIKKECGINNNDMYTVQEIVYDPYKYSSFVVKNTGEPIYYADFVYLNSNGSVYVQKHRWVGVKEY